MPHITRDSLLTLEAYARTRTDFRASVLEHKKPRTVHLGEHLTLLFEDELTIRYQIQEMLRIEKAFEEDAIQDELDAYNPLVPDGSNLKATMLIEIPDVQLRPVRLAQMKGVEDCCYLQVVGRAAGCDRVFAIADEDLERANDTKTSAVHFLRFEFTPAMVAALRSGAALAAGVEHAQYQHRVESLPVATRAALINDLE